MITTVRTLIHFIVVSALLMSFASADAAEFEVGSAGRTACTRSDSVYKREMLYGSFELSCDSCWDYGVTEHSTKQKGLFLHGPFADKSHTVYRHNYSGTGKITVGVDLDVLPLGDLYRARFVRGHRSYGNDQRFKHNPASAYESNFIVADGNANDLSSLDSPSDAEYEVNPIVKLVLFSNGREVEQWKLVGEGELGLSCLMHGTVTDAIWGFMENLRHRWCGFMFVKLHDRLCNEIISNSNAKVQCWRGLKMVETKNQITEPRDVHVKLYVESSNFEISIKSIAIRWLPVDFRTEL